MSEAAAAPVHARTSDVPEAERFDYFRDALSDVYLGIRTEWSGTGVFDAAFDSYPVDGDVLAHMWAPGHVGRRGSALVKQRPDEAVYLNLSTSGDHTVSHLDRAWQLGRGMPILLDSESPFVVDFADRARFRLYSLRIEKRPGFEPTRRDVLRINEQLTRTTSGRALATQARLMCAEIEAGRPEVAAAMAAPVRALLRVLAGSPDDPETRLDEFKAVARARLTAPDLRADEVAAAFGLTGRTVQSAFQVAGETFGAWLLAERLDLACERLVSPAWRRRGVAAIAAACGFRDPTHFHRAFRTRFGMTPGELRAGR
ncbi:helix-turn-helix transcriptional regulator [Pseudolysinimonas yzui]|uniref:Transcriptional regulator n=1 Tax=Pseudolysinimonas yzui TaxID=2708254 RepID=A0A8J3M0F2_9MICO|nr:AraC family transcriptional regulator [Pseudolysinimonas yzui]GHF13760.1 transcriptional regulator [Pseudolysinimonas yzui]